MTSKYTTVIGVDPDSDKSGFAVARDKELISLHNLRIEEVEGFLSTFDVSNTIVHVEDVTKRTSAFTAIKATGIKLPKLPNAKVYITKSQLLRALKIAQDVGRNKAAESNVVRLIKELGFTVVLEEPSKKWKEGSEVNEFKKVTKWSKQSNPDTRSAAYFAYRGLLCK